MPQGLPTSDSLPIPPQQNLISAKPTNATTATTIVISKEAVLTSVCESLLSNSEANTSHVPKTIDLVVVPSAAPGITTPCQYKLSDIVSREKDVLFQTDTIPDDELEPPRHGVYSVRRRSRQFFTVTEEDENDSESENRTQSVETRSETEKTVEVQPIFNLGESLKKLYFPQQHKTQKGKKRVLKKSHGEPHHSRGYHSDPEGKIGLCDIIKNDPELKQYNSNQELNLDENMLPSTDSNIGVRQSKSLPNTPRVSPKLLRRNSLKNENQGELQKSGPGFSFLASVAGELHMKKLQQDKKLEKGVVKVSEGSRVAPRSAGVVKVSEGSHVAPRPAEPLQVTAKSHTMTTTSHHSEHSSEIHTHHMHDFSDSAGVDLESHKPAFISSIIKWGSTKKTNVTNKESNMFSPTSF